MKVLMMNGSPRLGGNTAVALREMEAIFKAEGIETEIIQVGNKAIRAASPAVSAQKRASASLTTLSTKSLQSLRLVMAWW